MGRATAWNVEKLCAAYASLSKAGEQVQSARLDAIRLSAIDNQDFRDHPQSKRLNDLAGRCFEMAEQVEQEVREMALMIPPAQSIEGVEGK